MLSRLIIVVLRPKDDIMNVWCNRNPQIGICGIAVFRVVVEAIKYEGSEPLVPLALQFDELKGWLTSQACTILYVCTRNITLFLKYTHIINIPRIVYFTFIALWPNTTIKVRASVELRGNKVIYVICNHVFLFHNLMDIRSLQINLFTNHLFKDYSK